MLNRRAHFDRLYACGADPWSYETSAYEAAKYAATLDALPRRRFLSGLEVGCSIGVLSDQLSRRCDRFLGIDLSPIAIGRARRRLVGRESAAFAVAEVPAFWPDGRFDLIVLSEILYYLDLDEVSRLSVHVRAALLRGGICVLVNWLGSTGTPVSGAEAADAFCSLVDGSLAERLECRVTTAQYDLRILTQQGR